MPDPLLQTYRHRRRDIYLPRTNRRPALIAAVIVVVLAAGAATAFAWRAHDARRQPSISAKASASVSKPTSRKPATGKSSTPASSPAEKPSSASRPETISIAAVGDMLFDRNVKKLVQQRGGEAPLRYVASHLAKADVTVGNLETPLATGGTRNPVKEPQYAFRGDQRGVKGLSAAGFDAVSLANNHMMDYGTPALTETLANLDRAGIAHSGAGTDTAGAWKPATVVTPDGTRIAYLAFTHILPPGYLAGTGRAGVASGKMDMKLVTDAIRKAKKNHDYVLVSFHWGVEYEPAANGDQRHWAHQAVDAGADMVLAHHPHVIQGVEYYKDRLIAYSLGDFVFDHYSRETGESFILDARLGPDGVTDAVATPVYLDQFGAPEFVTGSEASTILSRLKKISSPFGTTVTLDGSQARISR